METLRYHRNCEEISIYSFNKISEEGDLRHLINGWDEYSEPEIEVKKCEDLWREIFNEYCHLSDDNKIILFYEVHQDLMKMKAKQFAVYKLVEVFITVTDDDMLKEFADMFEEFGYPIDLSKGVIPEANRMIKRMKFFNNAINVKQKEYDDLKGDVGEATPFLKQVVAVEKATKRDNIDIRKTSAKKWVYIIKSLEDVK